MIADLSQMVKQKRVFWLLFVVVVVVVVLLLLLSLLFFCFFLMLFGAFAVSCVFSAVEN